MPCNGHQNCLNKYLTFQQTSSQCSHFRSNYRKYSVKKVFLKISQNSRESTCTRVSLLKILKEIFKNSFLQSISNLQRVLLSFISVFSFLSVLNAEKSWRKWQKQSTGGVVLWKRCSPKYWKIHRKTTASVPLFK